MMESTYDLYQKIKTEQSYEAQNILRALREYAPNQAYTKDIDDQFPRAASVIWLSQNLHSPLSEEARQQLEIDYFRRRDMSSVLHLSASYKTEKIYLSLAFAGFILRTRKKAMIISALMLSEEIVDAVWNDHSIFHTLKNIPALFITGALSQYTSLTKHSGYFAEVVRQRAYKGRPTVYVDVLPNAVAYEMQNGCDKAKAELRQEILSSSFGNVLGGRLLWGPETFISISAVPFNELNQWQVG